MKEEKYGYTVFYLMNKPSYGYHPRLYDDSFSHLAMVIIFSISSEITREMSWIKRRYEKLMGAKT